MRAAILSFVLAAPAFGQFADFDADVEGFKTETFTSGGITFFDCNNVTGFYPDGAPFDPTELGTQYIVERSIPLFNDFPGEGSIPNTLTFGRAFVPGDNLTIGPLAIAHFTAPGQFNAASFDLFYYENGPWGGIEVWVEALLDDEIVAQTSFVVAGSDPLGRDNPAHRAMSIAAPAFDTVRVFAANAAGYTTIRGMFDDVAMTPVPAPAGAMAVVGLGVMVARRRRR